jgi:hypothetical protein
MATILSFGTCVQLACPLPPTPMTAIFNLLPGEHPRKFGRNIAPVAAAEAVFINDLRDRFAISLKLSYNIELLINGIIKKYNLML